MEKQGQVLDTEQFPSLAEGPPWRVGGGGGEPGSPSDSWRVENKNTHPAFPRGTQQDLGPGLRAKQVSFIYVFLGPHLQHMEVSRLGIELEL